MKGHCQICGSVPLERAPIHFPFGSPSQCYRPDTYLVCLPCVITSPCFDLLPINHMPEFGEYDFFVYYTCPPSCGKCGPDHALSIEEVEHLVSDTSKCPVREVSIDYDHAEHFFPSLDALMRKLPRKYVPNATWKLRELNLINESEVRLHKRRKEVESLKE